MKRATASLGIIHTRYEKEKEKGNHDDLVDDMNLKMKHLNFRPLYWLINALREQVRIDKIYFYLLTD